MGDPAAEWREPAKPAEPADGGTASADADPADFPPPESRELRAFTEAELVRIRRVQPIVRRAARENSIPADLLNGIIWVESKFKTRARNRRGPRGLMQLMPRTGRALARSLGRRYRPYDPSFNIHAGSHYFARMVRRFDGNLRLALAAYQIGPGTVRRWVENHEPLPERCEQYIANVFTAARAFREREL
ncbi:MAG: lytic transglycosylase domain-containing protein [Myxococcales bacterium]|nr:lytic transglycosylase domain-containing protein [Myxococcales bacterium]